EGVEEPEQLGPLRALGVHFAQGHHLGMPMPATDIPGFLARTTAGPGVVGEPGALGGPGAPHRSRRGESDDVLI
ncbi:MAG: hypothetical protein ACRYF3_02900, partial [Janthinobacterium lividum]